MVVSYLVVKKLKEIADSTEQSYIGELEHTLAQYKMDIHPRTLEALKYHGYVEEYSINPFSDVIINYLRVTDKGIKYLVRYHKYELSNRDTKKW